MRPAGILLVALVALLTGCADRERGAAAGPRPAEDPSPPRTATTRVDVVEGLGAKGAFDPAAIYRRLSPGVVTVVSSFGATPGALPGGGGGESGLGSGFVLDGDGYVATNAHVVTTGEAPRLQRAREVYVELADENRVPARIVGDDPNSDVALLKIDPRGLRLTPLSVGRSAGLTVGDPVAAIGSPFGERQSLSIGVISAVDREIESLTAFRIGDAIQTDAAINQGNSGGPLLDARGRVIGINSQIKSSSGGGEGVGFAVPADTVRRSLDELRRRGRVAYAFLGVASQPLYPQLADRLGLPAESGAIVAEVERGSPAERAGLVAGRRRIAFQGARDIPTDGDVLVSADGRPLSSPGDLADYVATRRPGQRVRFGVLRGAKRREVSVTLAERPNRAPPPVPPR
ncbi:MAG: S1C family serine protease [Thermoleophilaceae bacterium]